MINTRLVDLLYIPIQKLKNRLELTWVGLGQVS